jgi:DnaJ-class molecular chaperone
MLVELSKQEIKLILDWCSTVECDYSSLEREEKELRKKLNLLILEPCPECNGTGSILNPDTSVYIPCKRCKGRGILGR